MQFRNTGTTSMRQSAEIYVYCSGI